tara:strand:+ start:20 stop:163 length:144 start_codon:yes stop_codon:yes gene_type:complete
MDAKSKTETKEKEPEYPVWPGPEEAEPGVVYKSGKSGNLIQKGDIPL